MRVLKSFLGKRYREHTKNLVIRETCLDSFLFLLFIKSCSCKQIRRHREESDFLLKYESTTKLKKISFYAKNVLEADF